MIGHVLARASYRRDSYAGVERLHLKYLSVDRLVATVLSMPFDFWTYAAPYGVSTYTEVRLAFRDATEKVVRYRVYGRLQAGARLYEVVAAAPGVAGRRVDVDVVISRYGKKRYRLRPACSSTEFALSGDAVVAVELAPGKVYFVPVRRGFVYSGPYVEVIGDALGGAVRAVRKTLWLGYAGENRRDPSNHT